MSVYLPDNRITAPELLYPGRKPTVPVKINWQHPLTKGLVGCYLLNGSGKNYVNGRMPLFKNKVSFVNNEIVLPDIADAYLDYGVGVNELLPEISVITNASVTRADSYAQFVGIRDNTNYEYSLRVNGGALQVLLSSGSLGTATFPFDGSYHSCGFTHSNPTKVVKVYLDGKVTDIGTNSTRNLKNQSFRIGAYTSPLDYRIVGNVRFVYVFERVLPEIEVKALHINPYQFLEAA